MKIANILILFFLSFSASAKWLCHEASSLREGNTITACGIGLAKIEADARANALKRAYEELDSICNRSIDCKDKELFIEPLRNECLAEDDGYKCYRGVTATITTKERPKEPFQKEVDSIIEKEKVIIPKVSDYHCDYKFTPIESLLKKRKIKESVEKMKEIPFQQRCSELHLQYIGRLKKLESYPQDYVNFLYAILLTFEGELEDRRVSLILDYLYQKGEWDSRGWKRIYTAIQKGTKMSFTRYSKLLFHLDSNDRETQLLRIRGIIADLKNKRLGYPTKLNPDKAMLSLLNISEEFWYRETLFKEYFIKEKEINHSKRILENLAKSLERDFKDPKKRESLKHWFSHIFKYATAMGEVQEFIVQYMAQIDREVVLLDPVLEEDAVTIAEKKQKREFLKGIVAINPSPIFDKVERKHRLKTMVIFCLKEGLKCQIIPSEISLKKRLTSKKNKTLSETLEFLEFLPEVTTAIKNELFDLLKANKNSSLRKKIFVALLNTEIQEKSEIDLLLKYSWDRAYDYQELTRKLGKKILISLTPIIKDSAHKNRDLAIEMTGLLGSDAKDVLPELEKIAQSKEHYSVVNRAKKAVKLIKGDG
jgi:hypothetical protein